MLFEFGFLYFVFRLKTQTLKIFSQEKLTSKIARIPHLEICSVGLMLDLYT